MKIFDIFSQIFQKSQIFFFSAIFLLWHCTLTPCFAFLYCKVNKEISVECPPLLIGSLPLSLGGQSTKDEMWLISCSQRSLNEPSLQSPCSAKAQTTQQEQHLSLCTHHGLHTLKNYPGFAFF